MTGNKLAEQIIPPVSVADARARLAAFTVTISIDTAVVAQEGTRYGLPLEKALAAVISDCENRMVDAIRFRDGVERVASQVRTR